MELAFQQRTAYGGIQEKMAEMKEEGHLNLKVETPLEHKTSVAEVEEMREKMVLELQEVELVAVPWVEHV